MAISLNSLRRSKPHLPPLMMIYAVQGMGKTSTALECPDTVYLQVLPESPPSGIEADTFGELSSYGDVIEAVSALYSGDHKFRHVVIDSLDALEPLVWQETCLRNQWKDIEQPGYGRGYLAADHVWRELVSGCDALRRDKGIAVTWLALAEASNHDEPGQPPYKRYDLRLHKRAEGVLTQAADAVLFINTKVVIKETEAGFGKKQGHAEGGGTRFMFSDGRPAFMAKNRFNMPDQMPLPKGRAWAEISKYLPGNNAGAVTAAEAA